MKKYILKSRQKIETKKKSIESLKKSLKKKLEKKVGKKVWKKL